MEPPDVVASALDPDESVRARVPLGGEDALFVTDRRSLVYGSEGLLADESVEAYPHDAERVAVSEGRRNSGIGLDYGLDGEETLSVPADRLDTALEHVMAGVLDAAGLLAADEELRRVFRFSELSLIVTSRQLVKHIGTPLWDEDAEQFSYADVTDLDFEEGSVATSVVLTLDGRQERFKTPNEQARAVRESLEPALLAYHGLDSIEQLRAETADSSEDAPAETDDPFDGGIDPLGGDSRTTSSDADAGEPSVAAESPSTGSGAGGTDTTSGGTGSGGFEESGFEAAGPVDGEGLAEEVTALREAVERQSEQLRKQRETIEQLIEELRRGR